MLSARQFPSSGDRRRRHAGAGAWVVRYQLAPEASPIAEAFETKQLARDRFFTVKKFAGLAFCELRNPRGQIWFRDHYFGGELVELSNDSAGEINPAAIKTCS